MLRDRLQHAMMRWRMPSEPTVHIRVSMVIATIAGALILCWPAYLNGFPLVFGDTGNYIGQAILHYIGWNAPPFYSIFLLATDWRLTLWTPIFAQGLIVTSLLSMVLRQFDLRGPWPTLLVCLALAVFTGLPWVVSQLMADVFTGIVVLALALLGFGSLARWERTCLVLLAAGAIALHQSHIPLAFGLLVVCCLLRWWQEGMRAALLALRRLAPAPVLGTALVFSVNFFALGSASLSPFGGVVLAARMIGDKTGTAYLHSACPTEHYKICNHLDRLGQGGSDLLWFEPALWSSMGGERAWAPEASRIVHGTIVHDPEAVVTAAFHNGVEQFAAMQTGERLEPWVGTDGPRPLIARFFHGELASYDNSRQETGRLVDDVKPFAAVHVALAWIGLFALLGTIVAERRNHAIVGICVMVLAAMIGNALITGALSGVESRYAARIAWLLAFIPGIVLTRRIRLHTRSNWANVTVMVSPGLIGSR